MKYHQLIQPQNPNWRKKHAQSQILCSRHPNFSFQEPSPLSLLPSLFWFAALPGSDAVFFSRPKAVCFWVKCHFNISPSEMFEPVYEFPKQPRNAGKIFGISGLKVALNFGSLRQMKQIDWILQSHWSFKLKKNKVSAWKPRSSKTQPPQAVPSGWCPQTRLAPSKHCKIPVIVRDNGGANPD